MCVCFALSRPARFRGLQLQLTSPADLPPRELGWAESAGFVLWPSVLFGWVRAESLMGGVGKMMMQSRLVASRGGLSIGT